MGMDSHANDLFSLPEFEQQDELLSLAPVSRDVESQVPNPVAHVRLDLAQPHLDRPFDYEVPAKFASVPVGAKVIVEVGARKVEGYIVSRDSATKVAGRLRPIHRVVSNLPLLSPEVERLCVAVGERYVSPVADCLRLAIPQRHARAEKAFLELPGVEHREWDEPVDIGPLEEYDAGGALISHISRGERVNGVCQVRAGDRVGEILVPAIKAALHAGRGILVVVPTPAHVHTLAARISERLPGEPVATMVSEYDHARRYSEFLSVREGRARIVVGTRSAAWAPVQNLGLVVVVDDLHSALAEPRSPYIHARDLLVLRSDLEDASFLGLTYGPSIALEALVESVWAEPIRPAAAFLAQATPRIVDANSFAYEGSAWSRMPSSVFSVVREGLEHGPVLMVVPRTGYVPLVACQRCRELATCSECGGQLQIPAPDAAPKCTVCAREEPHFRCQNCGGTQIRAARLGSHRTAQEIGRAFRSVNIHISGVGESVAEVDSKPRIVVSTPGVEPAAAGGYAAGVILDAGYLLRSTRLDAESYFLRTVAHTAARIRPRTDGGKLLVVGDVPNELVRVAQSWDFGSWAREQLAEREVLGQPPTMTWVEVTGPWDQVRTYLSSLRALASEAGLPLGDADAPLDVILQGGVHDLIPGMSVLGPNATKSGDSQLYLRFANEDAGSRLAVIRSALNSVAIDRSAPKVRIRVKPAL